MGKQYEKCARRLKFDITKWQTARHWKLDIHVELILTFKKYISSTAFNFLEDNFKIRKVLQYALNNMVSDSGNVPENPGGIVTLSIVNDI